MKFMCGGLRILIISGVSQKIIDHNDADCMWSIHSIVYSSEALVGSRY